MSLALLVQKLLRAPTLLDDWASMTAPHTFSFPGQYVNGFDASFAVPFRDYGVSLTVQSVPR